MIVIPLEPSTLKLIAALNKGVEPQIDPKEHSSFIYHGPDKLPELVPTVMTGTILASGDYDVVEVRMIVKE